MPTKTNNLYLSKETYQLCERNRVKEELKKNCSLTCISISFQPQEIIVPAIDIGNICILMKI